MTTHKLLLDDDFRETFSLIAIHCTQEPFKLAYLLNKRANLKLTREKVDLEYSNDGLEIKFPLYEFNDDRQYTTYNLIANKCTSLIAQTANSGSLFGNVQGTQTVITHLIPEQKQVDYFLKIQSDFQTIGLRKIIADINEIKQVISAYEIDVAELKSKNNLIFD